MGVAVAAETPILTEESIGGAHGFLEHTQAHPPRNQHQKSANCLWVAEEVTESRVRAEQMALFPLRPLAHTEYHNPETWVTPSWQIPKALLFPT